MAEVTVKGQDLLYFDTTRVHFFDKQTKERVKYMRRNVERILQRPLPVHPLDMEVSSQQQPPHEGINCYGFAASVFHLFLTFMKLLFKDQQTNYEGPWQIEWTKYTRPTRNMHYILEFERVRKVPLNVQPGAADGGGRLVQVVTAEPVETDMDEIVPANEESRMSNKFEGLCKNLIDELKTEFSGVTLVNDNTSMENAEEKLKSDLRTLKMLTVKVHFDSVNVKFGPVVISTFFRNVFVFDLRWRTKPLTPLRQCLPQFLLDVGY